ERRRGELAARKINDDFEWRGTVKAASVIYGQMSAREGSATGEMFARLIRRKREGKKLEPALRSWLKEAMNDPKRFVSAEAILMFIADERREEYFTYRGEGAYSTC